MGPQDYIERANTEFRRDNKIAGLAALEEAYARWPTAELLGLLEQARSKLSHLQNAEQYRLFYERTQRKPPRYYKLGRRLGRRLQVLTGRRTQKIIRGCAANSRFVRVEKEIRDGSYKNVLDVGCWEGHFALGLGARNPSLQVTGIDIASTNIAIACELNRFRNVRFVQGAAEDIPRLFAPMSFDFVMLFEILEHVIDVSTVMNSVFAVMSPGGKIAITVPATPDEDHGSSPNEHEEHVRFFSDRLIADTFGRYPEFKKEIIRQPRGHGKVDGISNFITFTKPA